MPRYRMSVTRASQFSLSPQRRVLKGNAGCLAGVVPVEHGQTAACKFENLALGPEDALTGAIQVADMGVAYVGDDGDGRPHHGAHAAEFRRSGPCPSR